MKTTEAAKLIKDNADKRDQAIIDKQGMTGVAWNLRRTGKERELEEIADDIASGIVYGEADKTRIRKLAKALQA